MAADRRPGLLGRTSERELLDQLLANVRQGQSAVLVVRGEAGVGKTAVLRYVARQASGFRVARIGGVEAEMEVPFAGVHQYIDSGEVRLHAVIGGDGPPLLLVHGWPESWYAWRLLMPTLARDFEVIAVDQRGMGLSEKPEGGYDTRTQAGDLVGHDTGFAISYALAADHPDRVDRLALAEIPGSPGTVTAPPLFRPGPLNDRLWHLGFNRIDKLNEQLVAGREDAFYRWEFDAAANSLPDDLIDYYVRMLSNPDSLRGSFGWYRALDTTIAQDEQRKTTRLTMPVLAIGGEASFGEHVGEAVQAVADEVQSVVIPGVGHFVAEEAPEEMLAALTAFLAPYREGSAAAHDPRPHAAAGSRS